MRGRKVQPGDWFGDEVRECVSTPMYTGVLYGKHSLSVYDWEGREVLHSGSCSMKAGELAGFMDEFPKFMGWLRKEAE